MSTSIPKIVHLTSVHPRFDTRIYHKMCCSLVASDYKVSLVVADGKSDELLNGIQIYDVGGSKGRRDRILNAPSRVLDKALELNADLYHLHDPELIPVGLKLRKDGKRVIFDCHEDAPRQMLSKPYLNRPTRWAISHGLRAYEAWACRQLDGTASLGTGTRRSSTWPSPVVTARAPGADLEQPGQTYRVQRHTAHLVQ